MGTAGEGERDRETEIASPSSLPVRALDGWVIRLEVSRFVNLCGSDRLPHAPFAHVAPFIGGCWERSRLDTDARRGISPLSTMDTCRVRAWVFLLLLWQEGCLASQFQTQLM